MSSVTQDDAFPYGIDAHLDEMDEPRGVRFDPADYDDMYLTAGFYHDPDAVEDDTADTADPTDDEDYGR